MVTFIAIGVNVAQKYPRVEGGRVQRFQNGFTRLPPACCYADAPELAESAGWLMAAGCGLTALWLATEACDWGPVAMLCRSVDVSLLGYC